MSRPKEGHEEIAGEIPVSDTKKIAIRIGISKSGSGYVDIRQMYKNDGADVDWAFGKGLRVHEEKLTSMIIALQQADEKMTNWYG